MDLESRLAAYYGPDMHEQSLPQSSWLRVQANLGSQHAAKRIHLRTVMCRRYVQRKRVPGYIQDAFSHVMHEARFKERAPILRCALKARTRVPSVHVSFLRRRTMKLVLPPNAAASMEPAGLDVLLAAGLARYFYTRKLEYWLPRLLLVVVVALACATLILLAAFRYPALPFLIATSICVVVVALVSVQRRRLAFRADELVVRWLGRSRVCQGLHILAGRSRTRRSGVWGEPSLAERIERVCGTRVEVEDERLTLIR